MEVEKWSRINSDNRRKLRDQKELIGRSKLKETSTPETDERGWKVGSGRLGAGVGGT